MSRMLVPWKPCCASRRSAAASMVVRARVPFGVCDREGSAVMNTVRVYRKIPYVRTGFGRTYPCPGPSSARPLFAGALRLFGDLLSRRVAAERPPDGHPHEQHDRDEDDVL